MSAINDYKSLIARYTSQMDKTLIAQLPPYSQAERKVTLVNDDNIKAAITALHQANYLGFDTESKPTFSKGQKSPGVALIQLSTASHCYIFQTNKLTSLRALSTILDNPNIKKIGVGLRDDLTKLRTLHQFQPAGCIDLGTLFKRFGRKNSIGSKQIVALVLNKKLRKSKRVTTSNWAASELSPHQIEYAADDAFSSLDAFMTLRENFAAYLDQLDPSVVVLLDL